MIWYRGVTYTYDAFGNQLTATGTTQTGDGKLLREENPFRYASYVYDEETGFYYLQSRYYNPEIGRFITRDTIADSNMYLYTDNNPVNFVDHDGKFPFPVILLAIRLGIGAYNAYTTYKSIKNDPSASNILLSLVPGGKIGKSASKKLLSAASKAMKKSKGIGKIAEVSKLARNYKLSDNRYRTHILALHGPNSTVLGKSKFTSGFNIRNGINQTLKGASSLINPNTKNRDGYIFTKSFGSVIGYDKNGKALTRLKVVLSESGSVITAYPIR